MAISTALGNALSGLTAATRAADVVSSNLANVNTEGYARRDIELTSQANGATGSGVRVVGITRLVDEALLADRRLADSQLGQVQTRSDFFADLERIIGTPNDEYSLTGQISQFESALIAATSQPDSQPRLDAIAYGATSLATTLNDVSDNIQEMRLRADTAIGATVTQLNSDLAQIQDLNTAIMRFRSSGQDINPLLDQRQTLIDRVAEVMPIRQMPRDHDQVALYSAGGVGLIDGPTATFGFEPVGVMTPHISIDQGTLSGLTVNGVAINTGKSAGPIAGGRLGALFEVRDTLTQNAQRDVDAVARDLIERFEAAGVDPTATPGDPGLFTDDGLVFDPTEELGLAGRISLNALVDPANGGDVTLLRDGLGALVAGDVGDATQLIRWAETMSIARVPASGSYGTAARTASGLVSDLLSKAGSDKQIAQSSLVHRQSQAQSLQTMELANGVDSDAELQKLLLVERAYTANAKVIQAVDEMLQTLLGL